MKLLKGISAILSYLKFDYDMLSTNHTEPFKQLNKKKYWYLMYGVLALIL